MVDEAAQKFGLPKSLWIPVAARSLNSIEKFVGKIIEKVEGKSYTHAIVVKPHDWPPFKEPGIPLWAHENSSEYERQLHPHLQFWVHVDYSNYRKAYINLGMPEIPEDYFLDHIQNREAIRLRDYSHPYLRLCPVSRKVNTNAGGRTGGEGLEKNFIRSLGDYSEETQSAFQEAIACEIIYADPMDLTKMINIPPGTHVLDGVRDTQELFYPKA